MLVYLVRHGKAGEAATDAARPLVKKGCKEVAKVAAEAARRGVQVDEIRHSHRVRAKETAEIIAEHIGAEDGIAVDGLDPMDDVAAIAYELPELGLDSVMLVGHLPFMGCLASFLLTGDEDRAAFHFTTGTMACFEGNQNAWKLLWVLPPEDL